MEARLRGARKDLEALYVARAIVDELTAERASLTAGTESAKAERDSFAALICELEVVAATHDGELDFVVLAQQLLTVRSEAGEERVNSAQFRTLEELDKTCKPWVLAEGFNQSVGSSRIVGLVHAKSGYASSRSIPPSYPGVKAWSSRRYVTCVTVFF